MTGDKFTAHKSLCNACTDGMSIQRKPFEPVVVLCGI